MRTYDGNGSEIISGPRQGKRLPCCRESATGVCPQHIDSHMAHLQYDLEYSWLTPQAYYRARERAVKQLSGGNRKPPRR